MRDQNTPKRSPNIRYILMSLTIGGMLGGSIAWVISHDSEQSQQWVQCFEDESGGPTGSDANEALEVVRAQRSEEGRKIEAYQRALDQLAKDPRWNDSEQRPWIARASQETQDQIRALQDSFDESGDTAGCLEQY